MFKLKIIQTAKNDPKLWKKSLAWEFNLDRISAPRDFKEQGLGQKNELWICYRSRSRIQNAKFKILETTLIWWFRVMRASNLPFSR